jgi:hypothetical protein
LFMGWDGRRHGLWLSGFGSSRLVPRLAAQCAQILRAGPCVPSPVPAAANDPKKKAAAHRRRRWPGADLRQPAAPFTPNGGKHVQVSHHPSNSNHSRASVKSRTKRYYHTTAPLVCSIPLHSFRFILVVHWNFTCLQQLIRVYVSPC